MDVTCGCVGAEVEGNERIKLLILKGGGEFFMHSTYFAVVTFSIGAK